VQQTYDSNTTTKQVGGKRRTQLFIMIHQCSCEIINLSSTHYQQLFDKIEEEMDITLHMSAVLRSLDFNAINFMLFETNILAKNLISKISRKNIYVFL
jgi:hypothetical protein